jgi:hypothetical protein
VLRRIFGLKRDEVTGSGENCIMRSFLISTHQILIQVIKLIRMSCVGHAAYMVERIGPYRVWVGKP